MTIQAKVVCSLVEKRLHWDRNNPNKFLYTAEMSPVTTGSEENKKFFEATPSGSIKLGTFRDDLFTPGKSYLVTFEEVVE